MQESDMMSPGSWRKPTFGDDPIKTLVETIEQTAVLARASQEQLARQRIIADVVHQLKGPVSAVKGYADLLKKETNEDKRDKFVEKIVLGVHDLSHFIESRLDALRGENENWSTECHLISDLNSVMEEIMESLTPHYAELQYSSCDAEVTVLADRMALHTIFQHLVDNAHRHGRPNSPIEVEAANKGHENVTITVANYCDHMAPELTYEVLEPYAARKRGRGVGLYVVTKLVESMLGHTFFDKDPLEKKIILGFTLTCVQVP